MFLLEVSFWTLGTGFFGIYDDEEKRVGGTVRGTDLGLPLS